MNEELMLVTEVSEKCRIPAPTLRYWRQTGEGPKSFKVGRRVMYRRSDVEQWLEAQYAKAVGA